MKIALVASAPIPSKAANSIQVMKMAQAYAALGHKLELFVPQGPQPIQWEVIAEHYGLHTRFAINEFSVRSWMRGYDYALALTRYVRRSDFDLLHTRQPQTAAWAADNGIPTVFELHDLPSGFMGPRLLKGFLGARGARALVLITAALKAALESRFPRLKDSALVQLRPDGIDLQRYADLPAAQAARAQLGLEEGFTLGYTGHLYPGRGTDLILAIAAALPDCRFLLVGGEPAAVNALREEAAALGLANVKAVGFVPNAQVPLYQAASDLLLMPYQAQVSASSGGDIAEFLSPMKMFEYMAAQRPILASHLPVFEEVLSPQNARLLPPDDAAAWLQAIRELRAQPKEGAQLAAQARADVAQYTWESRAEAILGALSG